MPGAGNIIGANYVYSVAKPDGLTLGAVNPALYFDQLVGRSEVKFDWGKFNWIGSPEKNDVVSYMRADQPFKSIDDLRNAKEPPKCGSTGTGSTGHYIPRLLEETLGIKTQVVSGYPGAPDIELAIERGEVFCWSPLLATYFGREPRPEIVTAASGGSDHQGNGLAFVEGRLGRRPFKVQRVQKFKDENEQKSENFERLNLWTAE